MNGSRSERVGSRHLAVAKLSSLLFEHRSRSSDPSKTHPRHGAMVAGLGAIGRRCGSAMAWRPPL